MKNKKKLSPESILELFSPKFSDSKLANLDLNTSQVSDALNKVTGNPGVLPGIKPLFDKTIVGRAVTASTMDDDWGTSIKAIETAGEGEVLVIQVEGTDKAVWGELASKTAQERGIISTVIDGAVRDVGAVKKLKYPVFSKTIVPNAGSSKAEGKVNVPLTCGDVTVSPHDLIIGDECGVVVVPDEHLNDVIEETLHIKRNEAQIISKIEKGYSFSDILGLN